jgi:hypothetical protein
MNTLEPLPTRSALLRLALLSFLVLLIAPLSAQSLPEPNRWQFWARDASAGNAVPDSAERHAGSPVTRIDHSGPHDWAWSPDLIIPVTPGDLLEIQADLKLEGPGDAGPCFIVRSADGAATEWLAGYQEKGAGDWRTLKARVLAAGSAATVQPRIIGNGPATVRIANVRVTSKGNVLSGRDTLPPQLIISHETIQVTFDTRAATFTFHDKRNGVAHVQRPAESGLVVTRASTNHHSLSIDLLDPVDERTVEMRAELNPGTPEVVITLTSAGAMSVPLRYPGPIQTTPGQYLVIPMNEGISYPAEDPAMPRWNLIAYGGHGICMPFFGATDGTNGWMAILESPDDAGVQLGRSDGLNWASPTWESQRGAFGYTRSIRYILLNSGGHVALAKRYRQHAKDAGLLKTFNEKMRERPQLDKLLGAVNVWCWDNNAVPIVKDMFEAGIDRILWSHRLDPDQLKQLNARGVLTSRYDIYQDLMDPAQFPKIRYTHPDWTTEGFPSDIVLNQQGQPIRGWEIEVKGSQEMVPCAVLCDLRAPDYALKRIDRELQSHPYQCRFIDTTTATPWRECYHPDHPMTRTQSRVAKMNLLALVSDHFKLVCGSETGHDAAVPYCDYFEGMLGTSATSSTPSTRLRPC